MDVFYLILFLGLICLVFSLYALFAKFIEIQKAEAADVEEAKRHRPKPSPAPPRLRATKKYRRGLKPVYSTRTESSILDAFMGGEES